jgi:hypothetical protein
MKHNIYNLFINCKIYLFSSVDNQVAVRKGGHAQIFQLSPHIAARKKIKMFGTPSGLHHQQVENDEKQHSGHRSWLQSLHL